MESLKYLFDTCILVDIFRGKGGVQEKVQEIGWRLSCTASVCLCELYAGASKRGREVEFQRIEWLKSKIACLSFDNSAITYGRIRAELEKQGRRIEDMDLLIASIAIDNDLTLVTGNAGHYERIPGLKLLVWD